MTAEIKVDSLKSPIKLQAFVEITQNVVRKEERKKGRKKREKDKYVDIVNVKTYIIIDTALK